MAKMTQQELEQFSSVQFSQILKLQEQIRILRDENLELKRLLKAGPTVASEKTEDTDEEIIARAEITKLRTTSATSPLTLEEVKKLETLVKILSGKQKKDNGASAATQEMSDEDLFKKLSSE